MEAGQRGVVEEERHAVAMDWPVEAIQLDLSFASALGGLESRRDLKQEESDRNFVIDLLLDAVHTRVNRWSSEVRCWCDRVRPVVRWRAIRRLRIRRLHCDFRRKSAGAPRTAMPACEQLPSFL